MDPRAGLEGENVSPPLGFDPRTVQPVTSRCTHYATPAQVSPLHRFLYQKHFVLHRTSSRLLRAEKKEASCVSVYLTRLPNNTL